MFQDNPGKEAECQPVLNVSETLRDSGVCGLLAVNHERVVTALCPEGERLLQLRAAQVLSQPVTVLPSPLPELIAEAAMKGEGVLTRRLRIPGRKGRGHCVEAQAAVLSLGDGASPGVIVLFKDLQAIQRLEQHMRHLDRLASIGTLSASIAHEVKNALVPVKTFVELLHEKNPEAELGGLVGKELKRVESLISQMLRFAGPAKPTLVAVRVHPVLDQAMALVKHKLGGRQIRLERCMDAANDLVLGDAYQLEQAFLNVILNAIEAMGEGGTLRVQTTVELADPDSEALAWLQIVTQDTGVGIEPENLQRLFETFFTTKPQGTGLGLAITRRIVLEHQGEITLDSRPHQGTSVTIRLPLQAAEP